MTPELADGFDLPVGDGEGGGDYVAPDGRKFQGWYVATKLGETYVAGVHTGEDWNGRGGGDTDLGQPVRTIGRGRVVTSADFGAPWGGVVIVKHSYLEDGAVHEISSLYAHLRERTVVEGQLVQRRDPIGEIGTGDGAFPAHLHLELRRPELGDVPATFWPSDHGHDADWIRARYEAPSAFIQDHRRLLVPAEQPVVLLVDKSDFRARLFHSGVEVREVVIALGQDPVGDKVRQGDKRTPDGEYRVLERSRGPFSGKWAAYFGVGWLRLSYPDAADARRGLASGLISAADAARITEASVAGVAPPKDTALGGGIGIHGWAGPWPGDDQQALTFGCISVQNDVLDELYEQLPVGAWVAIRE